MDRTILLANRTLYVHHQTNSPVTATLVDVKANTMRLQMLISATLGRFQIVTFAAKNQGRLFPCRSMEQSVIAVHAVIIFLLLPSIVRAGDIYWTGAAVDPYWYYGMNWNTLNPPGSGDAAHLTGSGSHTALVTVANAACSTLEVGDGTSGSSWTLDVRNFRTLQVGETLTCGGNGTVIIRSNSVLNVGNAATSLVGGAIRVSSAGSLNAGALTADGGALYLDGGTLSCTNLDTSNGNLDCAGGGYLFVSNGLCNVGNSAYLGSDNELEWTLDNVSFPASYLTAGGMGRGRAILKNGTWLDGRLTVGQDCEAHGHVVMSGAGSGMSGDVYLGCYNATGRWDLLDGATASCPFIRIGGTLVDDDGHGYLNVSGTGTVLTVSGNLDVGGHQGMPQGHGEMSVSNGALVNAYGQLAVWPDDSLRIDHASLVASNVVLSVHGNFSAWFSDLVIGGFDGNLTDFSYSSLSPGGENQAGRTAVSGNFWLDSSSSLNMDIGGTNRITQHDCLTAVGLVRLAGALNVSLCNDYIPDVGAAYDLLDWGHRLDYEFLFTNLPPLPPGRAWDTSQLYADGSLGIAGTGVAVEMAVLGGTNGTLILAGDVTPSEDDGTDFGDMWLPGSMTNTYQIRNVGETNVTVYAISLDGTGSTNFTVEAPALPVSLDAGLVTNFSIMYHPAASGASTATVAIVNDGIGQNPYTFNIRARAISTPGVETALITNTAPEYAECGGVVTDDGGGSVYQRGCCWSANTNPSISDAHTEDGVGVGSFDSVLTNLTGGVVYYVRAYASNEFGIAYGPERSFRARMHAAGNAMDFSGSGQYIDVPNESSFDFTTGMTVEVWFKVDSFSVPWQALVTKGDTAWRLHRYDETDQISFGTTSGDNWEDLVSGRSVNDGRWHHVAAVQDGTNKYLYLDGVLENSSSPGAINQNDQIVLVGENVEQINRYFDGQIDEIRIWNRVRTIGEIRDNMHRNLACARDGLILYYDFDQLSGTNINDLSGNGNTGAAINGPGWTNSTAPLADAIFDDSNLRAVWAAKTNSLASGRLSVSNAGLADLTFAVFGHNNAAEGDKNMQDVPTNAAWRLERIWRLERSGSVTGTLGIDTTGISDFGDASNLRLLVSSAPSFSNAAAYTGSFSDPIFLVSGQTLSNGASYTLGGCGVPTVSTLPVTDISVNSAQCGGQVIQNGGSEVTARGCCWSTNENPTVVDAHTSDGTGTGPFSSTLTNLTAGRIYYVRAYASNDLGVAYGEQGVFPAAMAPPGNALDFSGADAYVDCGVGSVITGALPRTVEAWACTHSFNGAGLFQAGVTGTDRADFSLRTLTSTDQWRMQFWGSDDVDVTLPQSLDRWHHYAMVYDGTMVLLYFDGMLHEYRTVALDTGSANLLIGRWANETFDGQIDELRVWNTARTGQEIRDNMRTILNGDEAGLVAYYNFDCLSGTNLFDTGSGVHHGTLINSSAWVPSTVPWFKLTSTAGDHGTITPNGDVYMTRSADTNFTITPNTYWHVVDVTTNGESAGAVTNFTWADVTADGTIEATFAADLAAGGTPHWWLAEHELTADGTYTFDQAEQRIMGPHNFTAAEEYIADTDPNNPEDYFRIISISNGPPPAIYFEASSNRIYTLIGCSNLWEGAWTNIIGAGPRMGSGGGDSIQDTNQFPAGPFYRLRVDLP